MEFSIKDSLRTAIELDSNGKNTVMYDKFGNPNIMVRIDKYNMRDIGIDYDAVMPAFDIGHGRTVNEIWVSKYPVQLGDGNVPISVPFRTGLHNKLEQPLKSTREAAVSKGRGWHVMTNPEYCAIWLKSKKNGLLPTTDFKNWSKPYEQMPTHDGTAYGVIWTRQWIGVDGLTLRWDTRYSNGEDMLFWFADEDGGIPNNNFIDTPETSSMIRLDYYPKTDMPYKYIHLYRKSVERLNEVDGRGVQDAEDPYGRYRPMGDVTYFIEPTSGSKDFDQAYLQAQGLLSIDASDPDTKFGFAYTNTEDKKIIQSVRGGGWNDANVMGGSNTTGSKATPLSIATDFNYYSSRNTGAHIAYIPY